MGWMRSPRHLTLFVTNFELDPVVVSVGRPDDECEVKGSVVRHECRYPWVGADGLYVVVQLPSEEKSHVTRLDRVSSGDLICLMVWSSEVQLRRC